MGRLIDISDERFWDILFDEACVEGQQADRIEKELKKIVAFDVEAVIEEMKNHPNAFRELGWDRDYFAVEDAIEVVRRGGVKNEINH